MKVRSKIGEPEGSLPKPLMTLREAADLLACSYKTVERLIELGEIEAVQVGNQRKPIRASVVAYYNRNKVRPTRKKKNQDPPNRRGPNIPKQRKDPQPPTRRGPESPEQPKESK